MKLQALERELEASGAQRDALRDDLAVLSSAAEASAVRQRTVQRLEDLIARRERLDEEIRELNDRRSALVLAMRKVVGAGR